jgi:hypothetical protein
MVADTLDETDKAFTVTLTDSSIDLGSPSAATVTVADDDAGGVIQLAAAALSISEKTATATITVARTGGLASGVTVDYAASGGTATAEADYTLAPGTLSFAAGQATRTFTVAIIDEPLGEGNETFAVTLSEPTGGATLGARSTQTVTIVDDDAYVQLSSTTYSVTEGGKATITVRRVNSTQGGVTVGYATSDGSAGSGDYTSTSGTLTFTSGQIEKTFTVATTGDSDSETVETVNLALTAGSIGLGIPSTATLGIADDDSGGLVAMAVARLSVAEAATSVNVSVRRTGLLTRVATVDYATANAGATDGEDYQAATGTLTFLAGQASNTIALRLLPDSKDEGSESLTLTLSNPTPAPGTTLGALTQTTVTINDDDTAGAIQLSAGDWSLLEAGGTVNLTVTRSGGAAGEATVAYTASDGSARVGEDYLAASGTLTFGTGQTTQTIPLTLVDDAVNEPDETVLVTLSAFGGGASPGAQTSARLWIVNDD